MEKTASEEMAAESEAKEEGEEEGEREEESSLLKIRSLLRPSSHHEKKDATLGLSKPALICSFP